MIHLNRPQCGYSGYTCTGIKSLPPFKPIICDNINYDTVNSNRPQDNNFYNLPVKFKGVVSAIDFIDLSDVQITDPYTCIHQYDPLNGNLIDAFDPIAQNQSYIQNRGDQKAQLKCYQDSDSEGAGILLPSASLGTFSPVPMLAVPTVALAAASATQAVAAAAVLSGCQGLRVTAKVTGANRIKFDVSAGKAIIGSLSDGTPVTVNVSKLSKTVSGKSNVKNIQIYLVAGYNIQTQEWKAVLDFKTPGHNFDNSTPKRWIKQKQIATVAYMNRYRADVIQSQCSPVDLRDWVSEQSLPSENNQNLYVFTFQGNSYKKGWTAVKDC